MQCYLCSAICSIGASARVSFVSSEARAARQRPWPQSRKSSGWKRSRSPSPRRTAPVFINPSWPERSRQTGPCGPAPTRHRICLCRFCPGVGRCSSGSDPVSDAGGFLPGASPIECRAYPVALSRRVLVGALHRRPPLARRGNRPVSGGVHGLRRGRAGRMKARVVRLPGIVRRARLAVTPRPLVRSRRI